MVLRYMEKIKSFDFEKKFFNLRGETPPLIPIDKFLPENLTMLLLAVMVASASGSLYDLAGLAWYFSLPSATASGLLMCFIIRHLLANAFDRVSRNSLPKGDAAAGLEGYCIEYIEADGLGKARLFYKERVFEVNAAQSAELDTSKAGIQVDEKVIVVYESDGYYFVVKVDQVYN